MSTDPERSSQARAAAELALVRVAHHYGATPGFVLLGGLVPPLLCAGAPYGHAGTTDVDVQVDLEIASGSVNAARLEQALLNAEFRPSGEHEWRWRLTGASGQIGEVKFELLADLDNEPDQAPIHFDACDQLGAVNLRGTGYAARDKHPTTLTAKDGGVLRTVTIEVTGLAGFLMAKAAAFNGRHHPKDAYDIGYVLLHNDAGGVEAAIAEVDRLFPGVGVGEATTWLRELRAAFDDEGCPGSLAYAGQMKADNPGEDLDVLTADAHQAVTQFCDHLLA